MIHRFAPPALFLALALTVPGLHAGELALQLSDPDGTPLQYAVATLAGPEGAVPATSATLDQIDKQFVPYVLAVHRGTRVGFPNRDNIRHHVYSFSEPKRFELRLYQGTPAEPVLFDQPGVVVLGCNIHDWMLGYVFVTDDPWYGVSDAAGQVRFESLPAGRYRLSLWHPQAPGRLPQAAGEIEIGAGRVVIHPATVALQGPPVSPPSAPAPSGFAEAFRSKRADAKP